MTYLDFLQACYDLLSKAGTRIPAVITGIQTLTTDLQDPAGLAYLNKITADLQDLVTAAVGKTISLKSLHAALSQDEIAGRIASLEGHINELAAPHGAAPGAPKGPVLDLIKQLWAAIGNNPAAVQMIITIITSLLKT